MTDIYERKTVATGVWFYDGTIPRRIVITLCPAKFSSSRFDGDDQLDETRPIPETADGFVYKVGATLENSVGGFHSLAEAKAWADAQPWGPVTCDRVPQGIQRNYRRKTS